MRLLVGTLLLMMLTIYGAFAQYINLQGNNPSIREYIEESDRNWDRPIIYVFYNGNVGCETCAQAMSQMYDIYQKYYSETCSIFEINYADDQSMQLAYDLTQPMSLVVVRINDGLSRGYYKIDNPQDWVSDPFYMEEKITSLINDFLSQ